MIESRELRKELIIGQSQKSCCHLLPADTEIPAPAMTTIFRFLCNTLRSRSSWGFWLASTSPNRKSRCCVVRGLGSANFLLLAGGGSSSPEAEVQAIVSGAGDAFAEERCDADGEG